MLLARVIAATASVTLAASMAARLGSTPMAAFQVCLQVWLTSSLLADGLAIAGQVRTSFNLSLSLRALYIFKLQVYIQIVQGIV